MFHGGQRKKNSQHRERWTEEVKDMSMENEEEKNIQNSGKRDMTRGHGHVTYLGQGLQSHSVT